MTTARRRARRGAAALFEFGIAAVALTVMLSGFIGWKNLNDGRRDAIHLTDQTQIVAEAIGRYVSDNYQAFQACLMASSGANIYYFYDMNSPVPVEGKSACTTTIGPANTFANFYNAALNQQMGTSNEYGQTYAVALRAVPPGTAYDNPTQNTYLEGFVYTTGGDTIPDDVLSMVARRSGKQIAFNPTNGQIKNEFMQRIFDYDGWMTYGANGVVQQGHFAWNLTSAINAAAASGQLHQYGSSPSPDKTNPATVVDRRTNTMNTSIYFAYRPPTATVNGGDAGTPLPANLCFPYIVPGSNPPVTVKNPDGTVAYPNNPTPSNPNTCAN